MRKKILCIVVFMMLFAGTISGAKIITDEGKNSFNPPMQTLDKDTINPPWDHSSWHDEWKEFGGGNDYSISEGNHCTGAYAMANAIYLGKAWQDVRFFHTYEDGYDTLYTCDYDFKFTYSWDGYYETKAIIVPPSGAEVYDKIKVVFKVEWGSGSDINRETKTVMIHEDTFSSDKHITLKNSGTYTINNVRISSGYSVRLSADMYIYISAAAAGFSRIDGWTNIQGCLDKIEVEYTPPNREPNKPSSPSPSDGSSGISTSPTLSWSCSDPDGDPLKYDVFFGTSSSPPKVSSQQSGNSYSATGLSYEKTYYWKIKAYDDHGHSKEGDVWDFTTTKKSRSKNGFSSVKLFDYLYNIIGKFDLQIGI